MKVARSVKYLHSSRPTKIKLLFTTYFYANIHLFLSKFDFAANEQK